jgi:glycosyltransferase involved in cell wall biosynthesis
MMMFDLNASGVVKNALRIAGAAAQAGMRTELWVASDAGDMRSQVPSGVDVRGFGASIAGECSRTARKAAALAATPAFASALAQSRPRIACSAGNHFHEAAMLARRAAGAAWDSRLIARFSNALPRFSWSPVRLPRSVWKRVAAHRRLTAMDRIVAVSKGLAADLEKQLLIRPETIRVIPNGVDIADTERRSAEPLHHPWFDDNGPPIVLGVGRLVAQKNFAGLIQAFARARQALPMRLLILGDGVERPRLERLARQLSIQADVEFAGYVTNPMPYYAQARLFVLPSRWEGMSNALLEALAIGCPVLATRCSGSIELLGGAMADRLVSPGDVGALANGIESSLHDSAGPEQFRALVLGYDLRRTLQAYVDLFHAELNGS